MQRPLRALAIYLSILLSAGAAIISAQERTGVVRVMVTPDRDDWTYSLGSAANFKIAVLRDGHPIPDAVISYELGPEAQPASVKKSRPNGTNGITVSAGTLKTPGLLRLIATTAIAGKTYRGLASAAFAPASIAPTIENPPDFDVFWQSGLDALKAVPVDARITLLPERCTAKVSVSHVSIQNIGADGAGTSRIYGILCEPKTPGRYPAMMNPPGAGVRSYMGAMELAEKGLITLQIGIHGLPVNLDNSVYDSLRAGGLANYWLNSLESRERYYYRRVYLGCVRANDFLVSLSNWDGEHLVVAGGSQGGALAIVTAALDPRVKGLAANFPALSDTTGYVHNRAGGWPHMFRSDKPGESHRTPEKLRTMQYYDAVNFARRLKVPGFYSWGYNDETCPTTTLFAAYNVITAPKKLLLALETGHQITPEQTDRINAWLENFLKTGQAGF
jgi:cephalosporin-C deacetylase-like acetyl esterase